MSKTEHPIACAAMIITRPGQVLLYRRSKGTVGENTWGVLGGKAEIGETLEACAIRETFEESRLTVKKCRRLYTIVDDVLMPGGHFPHAISNFFLATEWEGEPQIPEPEKQSVFSWFTLQDLFQRRPDYLFPPFARFLFNGGYEELTQGDSLDVIAARLAAMELRLTQIEGRLPHRLKGVQ